MSDCAICNFDHSPELHAAVISIRGWLRSRLAAKLEPIAAGKPKQEAPVMFRQPATMPKCSVKPTPRLNREAKIGHRGTPRALKPLKAKRVYVPNEAVISLRSEGMSYRLIAERLGIKRAAVQYQVARYERGTGQKLIPPPKGKPYSRPPARAEITAEAILAGWAAGKPTKQLLAEFQCEHKLIERRMSATPELRATVLALRMCACGSEKHAWRGECSRCRTGRTK